MTQKTDLPLGRTVDYVSVYTPSLLYSIDRAKQRNAVGLGQELPFLGEDVWNCYELSWLKPEGMPVNVALRIRVPCTSPMIVESKSLKLYLNSFSQTKFEYSKEVVDAIKFDLSQACGTSVEVSMIELDNLGPPTDQFTGESLDNSSCTIASYERDCSILQATTSRNPVEESLHTHLFSTLCPVTGHPDWASLEIEYRGNRIVHSSLIRYLLSYRQDRFFHELAIEQIFVDLLDAGACEKLTVYGHFLRRGGIDINPFRSTDTGFASILRISRQ